MVVVMGVMLLMAALEVQVVVLGMVDTVAVPQLQGKDMLVAILHLMTVGLVEVAQARSVQMY